MITPILIIWKIFPILKNCIFQLDFLFQFPHIKRAIELSNTEILFFGSPWAPPAWMKTNGMFNGTGELLPEMWQPWSEYFVKFVEAYEAEGIPIWGLTPQNEPQTGYMVSF